MINIKYIRAFLAALSLGFASVVSSAVPASMTDLSTTASSNSPAGTETIGTNLDDYLRAVQAILRTTNAKGSDIASSGTTNIGAATGEFVDVTGTTTITSFGTVASGIVRTVRFTGALTLTHNATSLILPGAANITTANGDAALFRSLGSGNWVCVSYMPAAGYLRLSGGTLTGAITLSGDPTSALHAAAQRNLPRTSGKQAILSSFTASRASASTITVAADGVYLVDTNGTSRYFATLSETLNIAASGANGLDTGAEAASTWYHMWAIGKSDGTLDGLISASSTAPTLPSGYTFKGYLGAVRNDSASDLVDFGQDGRVVHYKIVQTVLDGAATQNAWTSLGVGSQVPPTATLVRYALGGAARQGMAPISTGRGGSYATTVASGTSINYGGVFPTAQDGWALHAIPFASTSYYWTSSSPITIAVIGWEY